MIPLDRESQFSRHPVVAPCNKCTAHGRFFFFFFLYYEQFWGQFVNDFQKKKIHGNTNVEIVKMCLMTR